MDDTREDGVSPATVGGNKVMNYGVSLLGLLVLAMAAGGVYMWRTMEDSRLNSESKAVALGEQIKQMDEGMKKLNGQLVEAQEQLRLFSEIKKGIDAISAELTTRVSVVEGVAPEQDAELDEFSNQMGALQQSLTDLNTAVAVLRNESATREELDKARQVVEESVGALNNSVKSLNRSTGRLSGRVKKLEKSNEATSTAIEQLKENMRQVQNSVDSARKEFKQAKAVEAPRLDFQPSGGAAPAKAEEGGAVAPAEAAPALPVDETPEP